MLGQGELWVATHLFSTVGAHVLAAVPVLAGLILVTGAGVAGIVRITGTGVAETGRALRRTTEELAASVTRRPQPDDSDGPTGEVDAERAAWPSRGRPGVHASRIDTSPTSMGRCFRPSPTPPSSSSARPTSRPRPRLESDEADETALSPSS